MRHAAFQRWYRVALLVAAAVTLTLDVVLGGGAFGAAGMAATIPLATPIVQNPNFGFGRPAAVGDEFSTSPALVPGPAVGQLAADPFVTVTRNGPTDGGTFGSKTPGTNTGGVLEALNAVTTTGNPYFGQNVWIVGPGGLNFSVQISIPSSVVVFMSGGSGGEAFGPVLISPATFLNFAGPSTVNDAVVMNASSNSMALGLAVVSGTSGLRSVVRVTGSRAETFIKCFAQSTVAGTAAWLYDGTTQNCEGNSAYDCFGSGDPGIQLGLTGEAQHVNDSLWVNFKAEGIWNAVANNFQVQANGAAMFHFNGSNLQFYSFYSRGDTSTNAGANQIHSSNGSIKLVFGEQFAKTGGLWNIDGGTVLVAANQLTQGIITQSAGSLQLVQHADAPSSAITHNMTGGTFEWDFTCNMTQWAFTGTTAGNLRGPRSSQTSVGTAAFGFASFSSSGQLVIPGNRTTQLLTTNPPTSGTAFQNTTGYYCTVTFTVTTAGTVTVAIGRTSAASDYTPINAAAMAVGQTFTFEVPASYFFKVTLVTAVLAAGQATGYTA